MEVVFILRWMMEERYKRRGEIYIWFFIDSRKKKKKKPMAGCIKRECMGENNWR